ncbi:Adenylate cyclase [Symbiodinium microadriaticum]|uniref:Adenylate cyclase n=1 Tax=Symbiodinium microadriaticum TaxID=2951 RepID=A0A1Q9D239_SYMMI|nr:Adenylate cyclase [Symbiodinium microadriaticum]
MERARDLQQLGVSIFNRSPGHGIAFLVAIGIVRDFPVEINNFLVRLNADREKIGDYLSEEYPTAQTLRLEFLNSLPLLGTGVLSALQTVSHDLTLPRDWMKVDRLLRGVAHFWWKQHEEEINERRNEGGASSFRDAPDDSGELIGLDLQRALLGTEGFHRLLFSTLMLYRWLRDGHEMPLNTWVQLNAGIEGAGNDFPFHVQMAIHKAISSGELKLQVDRTLSPVKPPTPSLRGRAFVRYNGRPQTDGDLAHWPQASPHVLAAEGGVLAAGRMSPQPALCLQGSRARMSLTAFAQPFDAGGSGTTDEEVTWLRLHQWLLLLASSDDAAPFAFVSLKKVALLRADARVLQITLARRVEGDWPSVTVDDDWLELCLLLGDGRFQVLEAPELMMRFEDEADFQNWAGYLRELCCEDPDRRRAALKVPPVIVAGLIDTLIQVGCAALVLRDHKRLTKGHLRHDAGAKTAAQEQEVTVHCVPKLLPVQQDTEGGLPRLLCGGRSNERAATAPEGSSNRSLSLEDEELLCEPVTVSHLSSDIGVHSEPLEGLRRPDTSCRQNVPLSPLVRRKSLVTKQELAATSPLLRPPRLPVSRSSSVETEKSVDSSRPKASPSVSPRSPGGTQPNSASGTDDEKSPCPSISASSIDTTRTYPRAVELIVEEAEEDINRPWGTVERTFKAFCGTKPGMDGKSFAKLCKDSSLVEKNLTKTDVDIIFAKVCKKGHRRIGLEQFDAALEMIADKKTLTLEEVWCAVRCCGGPVLNSTKAETVRFYDDKSLYTGTHAQGGPDPGRKGKGTLTWTTALRDEPSQGSANTPVPNSPRDPEFSPPELEKRPRSVSLSEKKISQQLRGKDGTVEDTFKAYCANKPDMDGKGFVKLCKDCELVDDSLTLIDADLIFAKVVSRGHRRIILRQFKEALRLIADRKGIDEEEICQRVAESEGVVHEGTTADYVRFFDDKSTYTGTHVYGGPDSSARTSADQFWSSMLRPEGEEDRLPEMVVTKICETSPQGSKAKATPVQPKAKPRARLAITAKSKPPTGDSHDFTMVFTDVQGSTSLWEANPRAMELALRLHDATIRQVLAKHSGYEVTTEGDAFQIAFHDTADAVAFCLDTQQELLRCDWPNATLSHPDAAASSDGAWRGLRVRMGLHSGRPASVTKHEVTGRWRYAGPSVAMAKAIEGVCHGGQIIMSASSFYLIDGLLTSLGSPQVVDLGDHILEGHGLTEDSSRTGCSGRARVQLIQLVPDALAHDWSGEDPDDTSTLVGGRKFAPVVSEQRVSPGFEGSPAGSSITLCFVFTQGARELVATDPGLAVQSLGLLRGCLREVLRHAGDGSGYECQEDEGAFMLAFGSMLDAAVFSILLQRKLPQLPWPDELRQRDEKQAVGRTGHYVDDFNGIDDGLRQGNTWCRM